MRFEFYKVQEAMQMIHSFSEEIKDVLSLSRENQDILKLSAAHKNALKVVAAVNDSLYLNDSPLFLKEIMDGLTNVYTWQEYITAWEDEVIATVAQRTSLPKIDADFLQIMDFVSGSGEEEMIQFMIERLQEIEQKDILQYEELLRYYSVYERMWGQIDIENNNISALKDRAFQLKNHQQDFFWLYQRLEDYRSKLVLLNILKYWITYDIQYLIQCRENNFSDYFDPDIITADENEVFVDAGAWRGDSAKEFIEVFGNYKKIYCFEITPESIAECRKELSPYDNVEIITKALGNEKGSLFLNYYGLDNSSNSLSSGFGDLEVEVVTLDEEIPEPITWIKMDIEGAEQSAILGAKRHITEERPKLTICTYHNNEDIWKIPRMIEEMREDYRFYMRYNGTQLGATEFVFFAV